jgi:NAD(P)-dependent dehydrogenase (short-subunit alcohol dehydrogenase family)
MQKNIWDFNTLLMNELNLKDKVAVITGGAGVICSTLARSLAAQGVKTVILDLNKDAAEKVAGEIEYEFDTPSIGLSASVLDKASLESALGIINKRFGPIDILINGAGGNSPAATTKVEKMEGTEDENPEDTFFGLKVEGFDKVFDLNFKGTLIPSMVFAADMVKNKSGVIINISSMNSYRPLTKIAAYSAAKAAINNFTQWLAVHFAKTGVRVNAIAPGFLLTNQNRFLLIDENTGGLTARGKKIIAGTPMERYCIPEELTGTLIYLVSDLSKFVTGVVIPVDGGFSAYSGV